MSLAPISLDSKTHQPLYRFQVFLGGTHLYPLLSHVNLATGKLSPRTSSPVVLGALSLPPVLAPWFLAPGFLFHDLRSQVAGAHPLGASTPV